MDDIDKLIEEKTDAVRHELILIEKLEEVIANLENEKETRRLRAYKLRTEIFSLRDAKNMLRKEV